MWVPVGGESLADGGVFLILQNAAVLRESLVIVLSWAGKGVRQPMWHCPCSCYCASVEVPRPCKDTMLMPENVPSLICSARWVM